MSKEELKQGLTYISDRGSQLRYADLDGKEQWLQQVSRYKALEDIKRGQAVSIASSEEFDEYATKACTSEDGTVDEEKLAKLKEDPDPYIVLTNTKKHVKCIGLALEPAMVGEEVHVLPFGKFTYDKDYEEIESHLDKEYNPNFDYSDVGKRVYVKFPIEDGAGLLTTNEEEVLKYYHNIICVGYLTDAPRKDSTNRTTTIELSISGDFRGPVDSTQFEGTLGEDVYISKDDPIRLFAIGKEEDTKFHSFLRLTPLNKTNIEQGIEQFFTTRDFIAIQKLDGKTAYIYPKVTNGSGDVVNEIFDPSSVINDEDKAFIHMSNVYREIAGITENDGCFQVNLSDAQTAEAVSNNIAALTTAIQSAFNFVSDGKEVTITPKTASSDKNVPYGTMDIQANDVGGYYELYISADLLDRFTGSTTFEHGSFNNIGKVVLADVRIPTRREILGVYIGDKFGLLEKGYSTLFMRTGEYTLSESVSNRIFNVGTSYYLGFNGRLTKNPNNLYDFVNKVAFLKEKTKLVVDISSSTRHYNGDLPVGYMKPSINGIAEHGFLPMDGETTYKIKEPYLTLYERLKGWYPETEVDAGNGLFKIPKVVKTIPSGNGHEEVLMQIKYLADGIYEEIPRIPFIRKYGQFDNETVDESLPDEHKHTPIKPNIKEIDITPIIDYGIEENGFTDPDISNLDIHLYVDPNPEYSTGPHNWVEIKSGFFNYNNTTTYGFNWKINTYEADAYAAPFGKVTITADIGDGEGIAYVTGNNSAPLKLNNCFYKVYVARKELFPRQFDIEHIYKDYISHSVYTDESQSEVVINKAVSGKAVLDAIANKKDVDLLTANKGATVTLGKEGAAVSNISIVSDNTIPLVSPRVEIANGFDDESSAEKLTKLVFENNYATLENSKQEQVFVVDEFNEYTLSDEVIPTVGQLRQHAEFVLGGKSYKEILRKQDVSEKNGLIHGMIFGIGGNVDASTLEGIEIKRNSITNLANSEKVTDSYIPYIYKSTSTSPYEIDLEGKRNFIIIENGKRKVLLNEGIKQNKITYEDASETSVERDVINKEIEISEANNKLNSRDYLETVKISPLNEKSTFINTRYHIKDNTNSLDENYIDFSVLSGDNSKASPITIKAGRYDSGSLSKYKYIYGEKFRNSEDGIYTTELDEDSIRYSDDAENSTNAFKGVLGSALQAAYELPMAYWQYRTEKDWYKKSMGVIVERVNDVVDNFTNNLSRKLFDNLKADDFDHQTGEEGISHNTFTYTETEVESIKTYLNDIINNSSNGINITDIVGFLLNAAKETQERLLKIETSTFGDDYETIPGGRTPYVLDNIGGKIVPDPTNLGLNRLIRAICLEVYQTENPFDAKDFDTEGGTISSLSRLDKFDTDIHGKLNEKDNTGTSENELNFDSTTYPYNDVVNSEEIKNIRQAEETGEEQEAIATEKGTDVKTREKMNVPEKDAKVNNNFNGIVDAIYRITTKLNALTESVNGTDNIANAPLRLNTIRQNIEHIIKESYFDDKYVINEIGEPVTVPDENGTPLVTKTFAKEDAEPYKDTNDKLNTPYRKDNSRFDRLTQSLYNFVITRANAFNEFGGFDNFGDEVQEDDITPVYYTKRQFNGKNLLTDTKSEEGDTTEEVEIKSHIPQNLNDYNYATLLDIVVDAIGEQYYRNNTFKKSNETDAWNAKNITRHNETISQRLDIIEKALDTVVYKLSRRKHFENDTEKLNKNSFNIESYTELLNTYLGYTQTPEIDSENDDDQLSFTESWDKGITKEGGTYSAEYAIANKQKIQAGLENLLYRLQGEESKSDRYDSILGKDFKHDAESITEEVLDPDETAGGSQSYNVTSSYNLTDDIMDILKTLYGTENVNNPKITDYTHRTLRKGDEFGNRFVSNNEVDDNIIDMIVNEIYYLPQPVIYENTKITSQDYYKLKLLEENDIVKDIDSRYAKYYDFDNKKYIYDIKNEERALSFGNRKEFFNQIGRYEDKLDPFTMNPRKSRFEVLENEIRSLRKLLGNNISYENYNNQKEIIELKFDGLLNFNASSTDETSFNGFIKDWNIDENTDQFNITGETSILKFLIGNDKSNRLLRRELGFRKDKGYSYFYNPDTRKVETQDEQARKSVYTRVYNLETEIANDNIWQDFVKDAIKGTGNIFDIVKYLGDNLSWDENKAELNSTGFNKKDLSLEDMGIEDKYLNLFEEVTGHYNGIKNIYDTIGIDENKEKATIFVPSETVERINGTVKKCDTLWARLNAVENKNKKDVDITNVVKMVTTSDTSGKKNIPTMCDAKDVLTTELGKNTYEVKFTVAATHKSYELEILEKDGIVEGTIESYTVTVNKENNSVSVKVTTDKTPVELSDSRVTSSTEVLTSKSYVDGKASETKEYFDSKYGDINNTDFDVKLKKESETYSAEENPLNKSNLENTGVIGTEALDNLIKNLNNLQKKDQDNINNLYKAVKGLSNWVNIDYEKSKTNEDKPTTGSLLAWK